MCSGLFAFASFFHQCHDAVGSVAPRAAALQARVAAARRAFAAEQRLWDEKRRRVEAALDAGRAPRYAPLPPRPVKISRSTFTH